MTIWKKLQISKYCFLKVLTIHFHFLWHSSWRDSKMLASRGPRKLDGRELMSRQLCTNPPSHGEAMGRKMCMCIAPMFALYGSVPKQGPLQLGSSFLLDGDRTLCIGAFDCCISLKTLPMINWNERLEEDFETHRHTQIPVKWWQRKQIVVITSQPGI